MKWLELVNLRKNRFKDYATGDVNESGSSSDNSDIFEGTPSKVIKDEVGIFTNAPASPVISSVVEQDDKVVISIDITAVRAARIHARKIDIYRKVNEGRWEFVYDLDLEGLGVATGFSFIDETYMELGTLHYRVYAVNGARRSVAAEGSINLAFSIPEVTGLLLEPGLSKIGLKWIMPETRLLAGFIVSVQALSEDDNWGESAATPFYSGMTNHLEYQILSEDLDKWHKFWVKSYSEAAKPPVYANIWDDILAWNDEAIWAA